MKIAIKYFSILALMLLLLPGAAHACSVCMGAADSSVAPAANGAIFFMLGSIGTVLAGVAGFIFHLWRRS